MMASSSTGDFCQVCLTAAPDLPFDVTIMLAEFKCSIAQLVATVCGIKILDNGNAAKIICGICLKDLSNTLRERLETNKQTVHESPSTVECREEPTIKYEPGLVQTNSRDNLKVHNVNRDHTRHQRVFEAHNMNRKLQRRKTCFKCQKVLPNKYMLIEHSRSHQRRIHQCRDCFKKFERPEELMNHIHCTHNGRNAFVASFN